MTTKIIFNPCSNHWILETAIGTSTQFESFEELDDFHRDLLQLGKQDELLTDLFQLIDNVGSMKVAKHGLRAGRNYIKRLQEITNLRRKLYPTIPKAQPQKAKRSRRGISHD